MLERVNYAYLGLWGCLGFYSSRGWLLFLGVEVFPYRSLLGRILRDPFHIGIPLRFLKTWKASHLLTHANVIGKQSLTMSSAYTMPSVLIPSATGSLQLYDPVNFMTLSALRCALPVLLPTNLFHQQSSNEGWRLSHFLSPINRRLIFLWLISFLSLSGNFIFYVIYIITGGHIISSNVVFIFIFSKAL